MIRPLRIQYIEKHLQTTPKMTTDFNKGAKSKWIGNV